MENEFYKTKLTIEVEIETCSAGPLGALNLIECGLKCPAVTLLTVTKIETDYKRTSSQDINANVLDKVPINLLDERYRF